MKRTLCTLAAGAAVSLAAPAAAMQGGNVCGAAVPNSTGVASVINAVGSTVVVENNVTLECTSLPPNVIGLFIVGTDVGFVPTVGGSTGNLCVGGDIGRFSSSITTTGPGGTASFVTDLTAYPSTSGPMAVVPGDVRFFQFWHRDTGPAGATSNFSPGEEVVFSPAVPSFQDDIWPMLANSNVGAPACIICHSAGQASGGLILGFTSGMAYSALVNVTSTSGNCGSSVYVVPGDPSSSLLYDKLTNTPPSCGAPMPFGGTFSGDTALIREWILMGAQP